MNEIELLKSRGSYEEFKAWVEDTNLFGVIQERTNRCREHGLSEVNVIVSDNPPMRFALDTHTPINSMEDLPDEMIKEFYINSPFNKGEI